MPIYASLNRDAFARLLFQGGAMAVTGDGSVTFDKPEVVRISDNTILANDYNVSTLLY